MATAREAAVRALMGVFRDGGYSNLVLDGALERADLPGRERAFCAALFYGVVERRLTLEYALGLHCRTPVPKLEPVVREILCCGLYQLLYMPSVPRHAAVAESVELARRMGAAPAAGLVNGVLRAFLRAGMELPVPKDRLRASEVAYSIPGPLIQLWRKGYGPETAQAILEGSLTRAPLFVRVNILKTTPEELLERLKKEGVAAERAPAAPAALILSSPGPVAALDSFREGLFHVQDLASQLCVQAAEAAPGMRVLDVCSAPGGKTFGVAQEMGGRGEILARDLHPHRLALVEEGAARLGLGCVRTLAGDATEFRPELGHFDRVLCDVVCSGFGILRRKPEIRYKPLKTIDGIWEIQYNILNTSSQYCAEGGRVVYSTCTLNPQENQRVVERFLDARREFRLRGPMVTRLPGQDGGDGFFWAVLEKERLP